MERVQQSRKNSLSASPGTVSSHALGALWQQAGALD